MDHWPFIATAYVVVIAATLGLTGWSFAAMRSRENKAASLRPERSE